MVDDLTSIKHENLKLIRRMCISVRIFDSLGSPSSVLPRGLDDMVMEDRDWWWPKAYPPRSYLDVYNRLEAFADLMRDNHRLHYLRIIFDGWVPGRSLNLRRYQIVLEPLASIYGIRYVAVLGVTRVFAGKMIRAKRADFLAVEELPEAYGTRMVRRKRKSLKERYKLRAYYVPRYGFHLGRYHGNRSGVVKARKMAEKDSG